MADQVYATIQDLLAELRMPGRWHTVVLARMYSIALVYSFLKSLFSFWLQALEVSVTRMACVLEVKRWLKLLR